MSVEDKLKDLILERYASVREFTMKIDMPYSTMDSILKRGISNAKVENILKICKELRISADALGRGEIEPASYVKNNDVSPDPVDVLAILTLARQRLTQYEGLTFNGEPADPDSIQSILDAMEIGIGLALKRKEGDKLGNKKDGRGSDPNT